MRKPGKCFHFRGVQHATCEAGVSMKPLHASAPCLGRGGSCELYREPTAAEIAESRATFDALMTRWRERSERGECSDCGVKIAEVVQRGSCVYALPCGHRVGQGDATEVRKALKLGAP